MKILLTIAVVFVIAVSANAGMDYYVNMAPFKVIIEGPSYDSNLPYRVDDLRDGDTDGSDLDFQTFCVESRSGTDELFWPGKTYWATVDNSVLYSPDPLGTVYLTDDTKKLYAAYVNNYDYVGNGYSYIDLQKAIWYSLSEDDDNDKDNPYVKSLSFDYDQLLIDIANDTDGYQRVKVLNIWGPPAGDSVTGPASQYVYDTNPELYDRQSQLVMTVPAPGAIILAGLGTSLVGYVRRRSM